MKNSICVIDFETTGLDPKTCRPVEVAVELWEFTESGLLGEKLFSHDTLLDPEQEITPDSRMIHHIGPEDVEGIRCFLAVILRRALRHR